MNLKKNPTSIERMHQNWQWYCEEINTAGRMLVGLVKKKIEMAQITNILHT